MSNCAEPNREGDLQFPNELPNCSRIDTGVGRPLATGLLFSREGNYRSDLAFVRRAVRDNWSITPEDRIWLWAKVTEIRANHDGRIAKAADAALAEFKKTNPAFRP